MPKLPTKPVVSAGGVVYRRLDDRVEVVLCGLRRDGLVWMLPKGTPRRRETLEQTARREVQEETGLCVIPMAPIGQIEYWFVAGGTRFRKTVHYFLMIPVSGETSQHDQEFDEVQWFPIAEALNRLSYPNEIAIVRQALDLIRSAGQERGPQC